MQRNEWRRLIATGSRQALFLLLALVLFLHLSPLVPPGPSLVLYVLGWVVAGISPRGRGVGRAFLFTLLVSAALLAAMAILGYLLPPSPGSVLADLLPTAPYALIPMSVLVPALFAWEWWVSSRRSGRILFAPLLALVTLLLLWTQADFRTDLLSHPWQYAFLGILLVILVALHHMCLPPQDLVTHPAQGGTGRGAGRRSIPLLPAVAGPAGPAGSAGRDGTAAGARGERAPALRAAAFRGAMLLLVVLLMLGAYRRWQDQAVIAGGGLLRPTLFRFDFADVISLEGEIQLSRELVMLYREDQPPPDRLLRRYVLSGYSPRRGFYRLDPDMEPSRAPPLSVREAAGTDLALLPEPPGTYRIVPQEYYVVNFDPDALLSIVEPLEVRERVQPARSSFNNAYAVRSRRIRAEEDELGLVEWPRDLPRSWRSVYVDTPVPARVGELAREITQEIEGYYETVRALERHLLEEYYYSLVPGDALDGDQLSHFLFESRRGYCSYFAFSMALMARSLGIPARVAAGFFVVPDAGMLGFHPLRGDMAHAWVEVYFPGFGWIEFDPTSQTPAPGEVFSMDYQIDRDQLAALVEEILAMPEGGDEPRGTTPEDTALTRVTDEVVRVLRRHWYGIPLLAGALALVRRRRRWRRKRRRDPAGAAVILFNRTRRALAAFAPAASGTIPFAGTPEPLEEAGLLAARARFGSRFSVQDLCSLEQHLQEARAVLRRDLCSSRRYLACIRFVFRTAGVPGVPMSRFNRTTVLLLCVLIGTTLGIPGVHHLRADTPDLEERETEIRRVIAAENYEEALRRIEEARRLYPGEGRFPLMEGDLYYNQELFQLALDAYRQALAVGASEYSTRFMLARTLARLNRDEEASSELEKLHAAWPNDTFVVGDLAWLYFKRHRLVDAQELLERTIAEVGRERDLLMTLATVRAGLFDYPAALDAYRTAIEEAKREDNRFFQAVAYYNKSILHANFFQWEAALRSAEESLATAERSSGYMIRAELHHRRLDLEAALTDYEQADLLDRDTPLPGLSLAMALVTAGRPEEAIARMERILARDNANWMYSYGTDPVRYQLRVYSVLAESWAAGARRDRLFRPGTLVERLRLRLRSLYRHGVAWFYRGMVRRQARLVAAELERQGRTLPALRQRMTSTEHFPPLFRHYAVQAESLEAEFNPESVLDYRLHRALHERDGDALRELVTLLDDPWRRIDRAAALQELYRLEGHRSERGLAAAARLYTHAPGSFLVRGLPVPVALDVESPGTRPVRRRLQRLGFRIVPESPLTLVLRFQAEEVAYRVTYGEEGTVLRSGTVRGAAGLEDALEEIARVLTSG
ncbi:MAG: hypothetical protein EA427_06285 [Spirochaetaceae bacterium]|nr:MAG: hypothetical protein EA427_06285 [Spirochaetaceae bacterium]